MRKTLRTHEHDALVTLLRQERQRIGLTQQILADRLGTPQSFVAKYEGGERRLDVIEFIAVARALQTDPEELFRQILREQARSVRRGRRTSAAR